MASYNELNALIDAYINRNGVQAITGQILNGVLKAMVEQLGRGYTIMGAATPTTDPGTPDGPECYFASETGTYTDFDGLQVAPGELALLCYTPSDGWTKATIYEGFREVGATIDGNVGTPSVGVSYADGVLSFDFHNMKGNPGQNGQDGAAAGFGTIGADITGGVGTPAVSVESSGPATAKNLQFHFTNLKGETGVTSVVATVDNTTGTPACTVSLVGQQLTLAFTGLKGAQGDTGSSVDYPFTIVNNLTTDDATKALSAAQGVALDNKVSQLRQKVDNNKNSIISAFNGLVWHVGSFYNLHTGIITPPNFSYACTDKLPKYLEGNITNHDKVGGYDSTGVSRNSYKSLYKDGVYVGYVSGGNYHTPSDAIVQDIEYDTFAISEYKANGFNPNYATYYKVSNITEMSTDISGLKEGLSAVTLRTTALEGSVSDLSEDADSLAQMDSSIIIGTLSWKPGYRRFNNGQYQTNSVYRSSDVLDKRYEPFIKNSEKVGNDTSGDARNSHKSLFSNGVYVGYMRGGEYYNPSQSEVQTPIEYDHFVINEYISQGYNPGYETYYVLYSISEAKNAIEGISIDRFQFNRPFYALGDSTTNGAGSSESPVKSWADKLNELATFTSFSKKAVNGAFCLYHEGYGRLSTQIASLSNIGNAIVTIMIGTNDFMQDSTLGSVSDAMSASFSELNDTTDFARAFRYCVETIRRSFPDCILVVMLPLPSYDAGNAHGHLDETNLIAIRDIERGICNYLGVPVVESQNEFGLSRYTNDWSHFFADFVHPNDTGYMRIAHCMLGKFIELCQ